MYVPQEKTIQLREIQLHVVTAGEYKNPAVLMLHGFPDHWRVWENQLEFLASHGYFVIAPDQRGYNLSDKSPPFDLRTLAGDMTKLAEVMELESVHVVGHDWGGIVAYTMAAFWPDLVTSLTILNAPHPIVYRSFAKKSFPQILKSWYVAFFQIPHAPEKLIRANNYALAKWLLPRIMRTPMTREQVDTYFAPLDEPGALESMLEWYRTYVQRPDILDELAKDTLNFQVRCPTHVIWGMDDPSLEFRLNDDLKNFVDDLSVINLEDTGHWPQREKPEVVNELILSFLKEQSHLRFQPGVA